MHVSLQIGDLESKNVADLLGANKKLHAFRGWLRSARNLLDIVDVLDDVFCPALGRHGGLAIK